MSRTSDLFPMPASPQNLPVFKSLGKYQSETILVRNDVGRIAFIVDNRVQMLPINYVYLNGWVYGRTAAAAYLPGNAPVAFEVEERSDEREWRTVVVQGQLDMVESGTPEQSGFFGGLVKALRQRFQLPAVDKAAVPFRDQLFCIRAKEISGRASLAAKGRFFAS